MITTPSGASLRSSSALSAARIFSGWCTSSFAASALLHRETETSCHAPRGPAAYHRNDFKLILCEKMFKRGTQTEESAENNSHPSALTTRPVSELLDFPFDQIRFSMLRLQEKNSFK